MTDVKKVADEADMIVNGYAFTQNEEGCRVLNLNRPDKSTVFYISLCYRMYARSCKR